MARVLLPLLAYAVAAKCARDYDYSGAPVPHYHFEPGNKAAMPIDYESYDKGAVPALYENDEEKQRYDKDRLGFKHTNRIQPHKHIPDKYVKEENINDEELEFEDSIPELKLTTHPRKKNELYHRDNRRLKYPREDDIGGLGRRFSNREKSGEESRRDYDLEVEQLYLRKNDKRKARRKPRDRAINREILTERENERQVDAEKIDKSPREEDLEDYHSEIRKPTEEIENPPKLTNLKKKLRNSNNNEYEYFDMKRINRIKDKLPTLLGPPKVRTNEASSREQRHQRVVRQDLTTSPDTEDKNMTSTSNMTAEEAVSETLSAANSVPIIANNTEQSLAEKSRLSILRKANKKVSLRNSTWTTKPPVLMQVTQRMQTVVVVERLNANNRRSDLREISNESPSRIAKAKKLMRHKLVSGAKNIQELTDNWDDMVCDYIDVSLLDSNGAPTTSRIKYTIALVLPGLLFRL